MTDCRCCRHKTLAVATERVLETESPITTAQDQVLKTNLTKAKIDESQNNPTVCAECAKRKMKGSCTSFQDVVNWQRKSTRRDMIA